MRIRPSRHQRVGGALLVALIRLEMLRTAKPAARLWWLKAPSQPAGSATRQRLEAAHLPRQVLPRLAVLRKHMPRRALGLEMLRLDRRRVLRNQRVLLRWRQAPRPLPATLPPLQLRRRCRRLANRKLP